MAVTEDKPTSKSKPAEARRSMAQCLALLLCICASLAPLAGLAEQPKLVYTPNELPTTPFGPPAADILLNQRANFLLCKGGPIALCYYSGPKPAPGAPDLSCKLTDNKVFSNCRCIEIEDGPYFVDINAILDEKVYLETVKKCGPTGANCEGYPNMATVCKAINRGKLFSDDPNQPQWDVISTFSVALDSANGFKIGATSCLEEDGNGGRYSGCMTAPCVRTGDTIEICQPLKQRDGEVKQVCNDVPIDECTCPNWTGSFQIGTNGDGDTADVCHLDGDVTWSAAYNPNEALFTKKIQAITQASCIPDAPGDKGCPMLPPDPKKKPQLEPVTIEPPADISCGKVCAEYRQSAIKDRQSELDGVEVGFTCDATICTTPQSGTRDDPFLIAEACEGLFSGPKGSLSEILRLELEIGCSCCASQICGCEASPATDAKIGELVYRQRQLDIEPQCDYNGSLCGDGSPQSLR